MKPMILASPADLAQAAAERFVVATRSAVARRGVCRLALSGGSTPAAMHRLLTQSPWRERVPWDRLHIFWSDERCVAPDHPDSNYLMARQTLLDHVPVPEPQIQRVPGEMEPSAGAAAYQDILVKAFGLPGVEPGTFPSFDLLLLGVGPDGHTASLFPGHPLLSEGEAWVAPIYDSPKPPPQRITFTLPVLNAARRVLFLVAGGGKADAVGRIFAGKVAPEAGLPAARVRPSGGEVTWLLDEAAARNLPR
ncbi:MAG: 6-phosphogluconolactonase [Anaerolineae bacterium]